MSIMSMPQIHGQRRLCSTRCNTHPTIQSGELVSVVLLIDRSLLLELISTSYTHLVWIKTVVLGQAVKMESKSEEE